MSSKPRLWTKGFILDTLVNFLIYIIYYMLMVIHRIGGYPLAACLDE